MNHCWLSKFFSTVSAFILAPLTLFLFLVCSACLPKKIGSEIYFSASESTPFSKLVGPMPIEMSILSKGYLAASRLPDATVAASATARDLTNVERDAIATSYDYLQKLRAAPPKLVPVTNLEEYFAVQRSGLPEMGDVAEDLAWMKRNSPTERLVPQVDPNNTALRKQVEAYEDQVQALLRETVEGKRSSGIFFNTPINHPEYLRDLSLECMNLRAGPNEAVIVPQLEDLKQRVLHVEMNTREGVEALKKTGEGIKRSALGKSGPQRDLSILMGGVFNDYADNMSERDVRNLFADAFERPQLMETPHDRLSLFIDNSGPQFKKWMQVLARNKNIDPQFLKVLQKQESDGVAMSKRRVDAIIAKDPEGLLRNGIKSIEPKPLATGSMAQVHKAILETTDASGKKQLNDVVVRFINPDGARRIEEDDRIFKLVAKNFDASPERTALKMPQLSQVIEELTQNVREELNVAATAKRQISAARAYTRTVQAADPQLKGMNIEFRVPGVFRSSDNSQVLIQEFVTGGKMSALDPAMQKLGAEKLSELFLQEAAFQSGFFHGDPHFGNVLAKVEGNTLVVQLLDYGMGGELSLAQRFAFIRLSIASFFKNDRWITKELMTLSDVTRNQIDAGQLQAEIRELVEVAKRSGSDLNASNIISFAVESGVKMPAEFVGFARGNLALRNMLLAAGNSPNEVESLMRRVAVRNASVVMEAWYGKIGKQIGKIIEFIVRH